MIKKIITMGVIMVLMISCKKDSKNNESLQKGELLDEAFGIKELNNTNTAIYSNYLEECDAVIEKHKQRMRATLPTLINNQVNLYKNLLDESAIAELTTLSDKDFQIEVFKRKQEVLEKLMESEISINIEYLDLLNELELVNSKYKSNLADKELLSFYDVPHIILSDEVLFKIQEIVADEIINNSALNQKETADMLIMGTLTLMHYIPEGRVRAVSAGLAFLYMMYENEVLSSIVPEGRAAGFTSDGVKQDLIFDIRQKMKKENVEISNTTEPITNKLNKKFANVTENSLIQFDEKDIDYEKAFYTFHLISNKLEGRIGDYSDGILSVYLQNVREVVKLNNLQTMQ